jgi:acyl carrier protein
LNAPRVSAADNFFNLGGHSLLAFQVLARIEKETGLRLPPRTLVLNTLAQVAVQLPAERFVKAAPAAEAPTEPMARGIAGKLRGWFATK